VATTIDEYNFMSTTTTYEYQEAPGRLALTKTALRSEETVVWHLGDDGRVLDVMHGFYPAISVSYDDAASQVRSDVTGTATGCGLVRPLLAPGTRFDAATWTPPPYRAELVGGPF